MKNDVIWRTAFRQKKLEVIEMIEGTIGMAHRPQVVDFGASPVTSPTEEVDKAVEKPLPPTPKAWDGVSDVSSEDEAKPFDKKAEGGVVASRRSSVSSMSPENDSRSPLDDLIREIMASQVTLISPPGPGPAQPGEGTPYADSPTEPDFKTDSMFLLRPRHFQNREPKLLSFVPLARDSRGAPVGETIDTRTPSQTDSVDLSQMCGASFPEMVDPSISPQGDVVDLDEQSVSLNSQKSHERVTSTTVSIAVSRIIGPPGDDILDDEVPPLPISPDWIEVGESPAPERNVTKRLSKTVDLSGMSGPPLGAPPFLQHPAFRDFDSGGPKDDIEAVEGNPKPANVTSASVNVEDFGENLEKQTLDHAKDCDQPCNPTISSKPGTTQPLASEPEPHLSSIASKPSQVKFVPVTVLKDEDQAKQEDQADGWSMLSPSAKIRMNLWNPFKRIPENLKTECSKHSSRERSSESRSVQSSIEESLGIRSAQSSRGQSSVSRSVQSSREQSSGSRSAQSSQAQSSVSRSAQSSIEQTSMSRSARSSIEQMSVSRAVQRAKEQSSLASRFAPSSKEQSFSESRSAQNSKERALELRLAQSSKEQALESQVAQSSKVQPSESRAVQSSEQQSSSSSGAESRSAQKSKEHLSSSKTSSAQTSQEPSFSDLRCGQIAKEQLQESQSGTDANGIPATRQATSSPTKSVSPPRTSTSPVSSSESRKKRFPDLGSLFARSSIAVSRVEKAKKANKCNDGAAKHVPANSWSAGVRLNSETRRQQVPSIYHEWPAGDHSSQPRQDSKSPSARMWEQSGVSPQPPAGWYAPGGKRSSPHVPQQPPPQYSPFHSVPRSPSMNDRYQWPVLPMLPENQGMWVAYWPQGTPMAPNQPYFQQRQHTRPMMEQAFKAEMQRHRMPPEGACGNGPSSPPPNPNEWPRMYWHPPGSPPPISPIEPTAESDEAQMRHGFGIGSTRGDSARSPPIQYNDQQTPWALAMPQTPFATPAMQGHAWQAAGNQTTAPSHYQNFTIPTSPLSPALNFPIGCLPPPSPGVYVGHPPGPMLLPSPPETPQALSPYTQPQTAYPPHRAPKGRLSHQSAFNPRAFSSPQTFERANTIYHGDTTLRGASYPTHGWMPARWSE